MRTNARPLPALAAALFLAASAAAVSGCSCSTALDLPRPPKTVNAFVTWDGTKTELTHFPSLPDQKLAQLSESKRDTITWCSPHGQVHIVAWSQKSPFAKDPESVDGCLKSGPPRKGSSIEGGVICEYKKGQCYEYKIELWLKADPLGKDAKPIDPRIEVVP
jgi:hypothetical protein